tara:strand:+ start:231 stop:662 length:432 start_codon:yes stop_codon:yes gene_type:complete
MNQNEIDAVLREYEVISVQLDALKKKQDEVLGLIYKELDSRSSDTNWATKLIGKEYECTRSAKKIISVEDFREALGEWIEPEDMDRCIRQGETVIKELPDRIKLNEVNTLMKEGGMVAEQIEKITEKVSNGIKIKQKETKNGK